MAGTKPLLVLCAAALLVGLTGGSAHAQWQTDQRIDNDTIASYKSNQVVARDATKVYACWLDGRLNKDNKVVLANYSHDNGQTWSTQDLRVDTGKTGGVYKSEYPVITCWKRWVYVAWQDTRQDVNNDLANVYFNRSVDGGQTWEATDQWIDLGSPANSVDARYINIAAHENEVYITWEDSRNGPSLQNVYCSMSDNYGAAGSWTTPVQVDSYGSQFFKQSFPTMATVGNRIYVAWQDSRDADQNIYMNHSYDGGRTWDTYDVRRVDTDYPSVGDSIYIEIAAAGSAGGGSGGTGPFKFRRGKKGVTFGVSGPSGTVTPSARPPVAKDKVYCIWRDYRNSQGQYQLDVYVNYSHDGGQTWGSRDQRLNTNHPTPGSFWVGYPMIAASGQGVYCIWLDEKDDINPGAAPYIDDVYVNTSLLGGVANSWSGPTRLCQGTVAGTVDKWNATVSADWPTAAVTWMDERDDPVNFYDSVYCAHSTTGGATWSADERVDSAGSDPGAKYAEHHLEGNTLDVVWYDWRYGVYGIFYNARAL